MTDNGHSGGTGASGGAIDEPESAGFLAVRSFVVRSLLEQAQDNGVLRWRGYVTDVATGERQPWLGVREVGRFIETRLVAHAAQFGETTGFRIGPLMTAPTMTDVVTDMLAVLEARLPPPSPSLPDGNVTLDRVREKLVGLGRIRGTETTSPIGLQTLRGGRLDARVRFQVWATSPLGADAAVLALQGTMLDDSDQLRLEGFLRLGASDTTVAEHVPVINGWRKTTAYDVIYEFQYRDSEDASSLIARIPIETDLERSSSPDHESEIVTDRMTRWDEEGAMPLVVSGPAAIGHIDVLSFVPGPDPGGSVTLLRTTRKAAGPPIDHPDIPAFLDAVSGDDAVETHAEVQLTPTQFLAALAPQGDAIEMGDWDDDAVLDSYSGYRLTITPAILLGEPADRLEINYSDPDGLDQQAILYLRVNAP